MRSTATAFPSLADVEAGESFTTTPGGPPAPKTGKLERGEIVGRAGRDKPGFLQYGPYLPLKPGAYRATFSLAAAGVGPDEPVALIEVVGAPDAVLARKLLTGRELRPRQLSPIELAFENLGTHLLETRVYFVGRGTLRAGPTHVQPLAPPAPGSPTQFPDWPLAFLWVAGTALVGWMFVDVMRSRNRRR